MSSEVTNQPEEHVFTKAQMRRFNDLQMNLQRAQQEVQSFIEYLGEEHDLDPNKRWVIGQRGFVEQPPGMEPPMGNAPAQPMGQNGHPTVATATPVGNEG